MRDKRSIGRRHEVQMKARGLAMLLAQFGADVLAPVV
jgi:hypothetical protein